MKGLLQSLGFELDCARASLNAFVSNKQYENYCKKCEKKFKQHEKAVDKTKNNEDFALYMELLQRVAQQEDISVRNPMDIALELGYSEEDVKSAFEYMQQIMRDEGEKD